MNISNSRNNTIINGSDSADSIYNSGEYVSIYSNSGNDTVANEAAYVYIEAGNGNDSVYTDYSKNNMTIIGGEGKDSIIGIASDENIIDGGADNDLINVMFAQYQYNYGNNTVIGGAGNDSIYVSDVDYYYAFQVNVDGGTEDDFISITNTNSYLLAISVNGGNGDDTLWNNGGHFATINAEDGHDYIYNSGNNVNINGGAGNDFISLSAEAEQDVINGGTGNDTIVLDNMYHYISYYSGYGDDVIKGFNQTDTLNIGSGFITKAGISGNDAIIYVGINSITLKNAARRTLNLQIAGGTTFSTVLTEKLDTGSGGEDTGDGGEDDENYITNYANYTLVGGTSSNDTIINEGNNVTINAGSGNDFTSNKGNIVSINGNAGNDTINNTGKNVTIVGGAGNDRISLSSAATNNLIQYASGDGKDTLYGVHSTDTLQITGASYTTVESGNDILVSVGSGSVLLKSAKNVAFKINGTAGGNDDENDLPKGWSYGNTAKTNLKATVTSADDLDLTQDYGDGVKTVNASMTSGGVEIIGNDLANSIKGGKGADTIFGGAGNDTVSLGGGKDIYIYSSGNDFIQDYTAGADSIQIDTDEIEITGVETLSSNVVISTSEGKISVKGGKGKEITLIDANGKKIDAGGTDELLIEGSSSADDLTNKIDDATIDAGSGNDNIENNGNNVSINAGAGNDYIYNTGDDVTIEGGAGRDSILNEGYYATIIGGAGNDTIENSGEENIYQYATGDGNDTIIGFGETDTLHITKGSYSYSISGNDFIVKVGSSTITLKDAANKKISIKNASGKIEVIEQTQSSTLPDGWKYGTTSKTNTNAEIVTATLKTAENIDLTENYGEGVVSVNAATVTGGIEIIGNDLDNSIKGSKGADVVSGGYGNDTVSLGGGDDIYIYSGGYDVIQDYVAGHDSIQIEIDDVENISAETIGANVVYSTSEGNLTVAKGSGKDIILMDVNGDIITIGEKIPAGWQLTNNILKATIASADNEIDLNESYGNGVIKVDGSKISGGVEIIGNDSNNSLKGGKGNDVLEGGSGNDTIITGTGDDLIIYSGGDDYITDYTAGKDSIQIDTSEIEIYSMETVSSNVVYETDAGKITVKNGKGKTITLIDGNDEEIVIGTIPKGWQLTNNILKATVASADNYIDLTEPYGDSVIKVDGSKISGGVEIYGNDLDNSIKGGKGADEIAGGSGNDTVSLGGGTDIYIYSGGDDVIQDYVAGTDSIQINTDDIEVTGVETVGNDIIYETSAGNIKVVKGKGKDITLMDENGAAVVIGGAEIPEGWKFDASKGLLQATISSAVDEIDLSENYGAGVEKVDGSKITSGVVIFGSDNNISMKGSKSADTISGGTGNDTVSLGGGADVYIYNGGNDLISDYANVDAIQIDTNEISIKKATVSGSNYVITTSEGNITLKGASSKTINVIDDNDKPINLSKVSKNVVEEIWFLEDDNNFETCAIDDITENKFAVTEIQSSKVEELYQPVLTFAEDK